MRTETSVRDRVRLSDEQLGKLSRKYDEIKVRLRVAPGRFGWVLGELQKLTEKIVGKSSSSKNAISYREVRKIMGCDLYGLEEVNKAFTGLDLKESDLPPIRCSRRQLKRFKRMGFQLILEIGNLSNGSPVTIRVLNALAEGKTSDGGKFLYSSRDGNIDPYAWFFKETFLNTPLEFGWRISSKDLVSGTLGVDYPKQIEILIKHLETVFDGNIPAEYKGPIDFFNMKRGEVETHIKNRSWKIAGDVIEGCGLDWKIRESAISLLYRLYLIERSTGEKLFSVNYAWTFTRASLGGFVSVGRFDRDGAGVDGYGPDDDWSDLGASLSLKL